MLFRIIACALTIPLGVHAQACPDVEIQPVPLRVSVHGMMDCENPAARFLPTPNGRAMRGCPAIVVVEPPYDTPRAREGCGTYVRVRERVPVLVYAFSCEVSYFLFIPIATNCVMVDKRVIGHRLSYEPVPCEPHRGPRAATEGACLACSTHPEALEPRCLCLPGPYAPNLRVPRRLSAPVAQGGSVSTGSGGD